MHESIPRALSAVSRLFQQPAVREVCLGSLAATHAVLWLTWFAAAWGIAPSVVIALAVSFGVASLLGRVLAAAHVPGLWWGAHVLLAGWTLALPGLLALSPELLQWVPLDVLQRPFVAFAFTLVAALLLIAPGWIILLQTVSPRPEKDSARGPASPWTLLGAAGATLLIPMTLAVHYDLQLISWTVSGIGLLIAGVTWALQRPRRFPVAPADSGDRPSTSGSMSGARRETVGDLWVALIAGIGVAVATRVTGQLVAEAAYVACAQIAGLLAGVAVGVTLRRGGSQATGVRVPVVESLVVAWSVALLVVLFPQLTTAALRISAGVSHTLGIFLLRGGLLCAALLPLGVAVGLRLGDRRRAEQGGESRFAFIPAAAACTFAGARAIDAPVAVCLAVVVAAAGAALAVRLWSVRPSARSGRRFALATACFAPLVASLFFTSRFDASRSARILFSTQAYVAYRGGTPVDQLHQIDDGRLIDASRCDGSTWTAWLHAGQQVLVRENGVPRGVRSLNTEVCPQLPTEALPAVLPLVIHPSPRNVTLIGVGGSTTLSACMAFPVSQVTCIEPHQGLLNIAERCGDAGTSPDPFDDSRLHVVRAEPVLAAATQQPPQDVIILNHGQAALWDAGAEFTTDFYRRLAKRLAPGGLLCQRLYFGDFGAQPVRDVAATLRDAFPQVILIETGPGELVFLASRTTDPIVGPDVLRRAARSHVRALLSQLGWDWSVLLTMVTLTSGSIDEIADSSPARANTLVSGRFTYRLPVEVARWDAKQQEIQELLGPHSTRLFALTDNEAGVQELALRLADVAERQRIIEDHPDVFWAYRDTLRSRLQERPRMTIQQVGYEGLGRALHPEDERRKEYLLALNAAATQSAPDADSLNRLERFTEPYDPLVSDFVHHELAHLYARAEFSNPQRELTHRLHSVYYGSARDQSVRNVSEAIELVIERPEALPAPQERWDTLNALLEVLMRRWQLRSLAEAGSRYEAADANSSLDAAQAALRAMDDLADEAAIPTADWRIRRGLLEQHLIRPLRNRRSGQRT